MILLLQQRNAHAALKKLKSMQLNAKTADHCLMFLNKRNKQLMAEKLDQKLIVDLKELLMSELIQSEALINLLDRKGLISKKEFLEEIKRVQAKMIKAKI